MRQETKRSLLLVGDFAVSHQGQTGFSRVLETLAHHLDLQHGWDISVLALGYSGDAHPLQYLHDLYPAYRGGDQLGVGRIVELVTRIRPQVVLFLLDPWHLEPHLAALRAVPYPERPALVAYIPVDGDMLAPADIAPLHDLDMAIAYTQFGADALRLAGLTVPMQIIGHGVDLDVFCPRSKAASRAALGMADDWHLTLVLDRNDPRKRLDLAFRAWWGFAQGLPDTVKLWFHGPVTGRFGDVRHLAAMVGIPPERIVILREMLGAVDGQGVSVDQLAMIYSAADVGLKSSLGEGWGLPVLEGMACGLPWVVPGFAALAEWPGQAVSSIYVDTVAPMPSGGAMGRVIDVWDGSALLADLYEDGGKRVLLAHRGRTLAYEPRFRWAVVADHFDTALDAALARRITSGPLPNVARSLAAREGTWDAAIAATVLGNNEYRLPPRLDGVYVLDIGAHIGSFGIAVLDRGAAHVECWEADQANAALCQRNLAANHPADRWTVHQAAVWRSDAGPGLLAHSGYRENTGGGGVVLADQSTPTIPTTPLDIILAEVAGEVQVRLLKLDCEGSEWPILLSSTNLDLVDAICGEYHEIGGAYDTHRIPSHAQVGDAEAYTWDVLATFLAAQGYRTVAERAHDERGVACNLGHFWAWRGACPFIGLPEVR